MATTGFTSYSGESPNLYLFTSLTSGSSHIVSATSRMETILKANRVPFTAIDVATDEKARSIWGRRAGKDESGRVRKLPGLVQDGFVLGDLVEVEDWNEYGELKQHVKLVGAPTGKPSALKPFGSGPTAATTAEKENKKPVPATATVTAQTSKTTEETKPAPPHNNHIAFAMKQAGQEAAQKAKDNKKKPIPTFDGVGEAEPVKKDLEKSAVVPPPVTGLESALEKLEIDAPVSLQSPTSTTWKNKPDAKTTTPRHSIDKLESLQSPNSTSWKPKDIETPVMTHRGSSVSQASPEEIKKVEEDETIEEEDEEDEDEDEDEDEEEDEDEDEDDDDDDDDD